MAPIGKLLITFGVILIVAGSALMVFDKIPWLGRLPGDIYVKREHFSFYFPITTSIIISIVLSVILFFFGRH